jgi:hypothetical protein
MVFFERRRVGTLDDGRWVELSAFRDAIHGKDTPVDPTRTTSDN